MCVYEGNSDQIFLKCFGTKSVINKSKLVSRKPIYEIKEWGCNDVVIIPRVTSVKCYKQT